MALCVIIVKGEVKTNQLETSKIILDHKMLGYDIKTVIDNCFFNVLTVTVCWKNKITMISLLPWKRCL